MTSLIFFPFSFWANFLAIFAGTSSSRSSLSNSFDKDYLYLEPVFCQVHFLNTHVSCEGEGIDFANGSLDILWVLVTAHQLDHPEVLVGQDYVPLRVELKQQVVSVLRTEFYVDYTFNSDLLNVLTQFRLQEFTELILNKSTFIVKPEGIDFFYNF